MHFILNPYGWVLGRKAYNLWEEQEEIEKDIKDTLDDLDD